jgi:hypothetical protein
MQSDVKVIISKECASHRMVAGQESMKKAKKKRVPKQETWKG